MSTQTTTIVNAFGKMAGWNSVTLNLFGRDVEGIMELGYDDDIPKETIKGANRMPIGIGEGTYDAKCKITLYMEEVVAIMNSLPSGARIQDAAPTDVIVQYVYQNKVYKDIIRNFFINKVGREVKQGDKTVGQILEVGCTHIDWNQ